MTHPGNSFSNGPNRFSVDQPIGQGSTGPNQNSTNQNYSNPNSGSGNSSKDGAGAYYRADRAHYDRAQYDRGESQAATASTGTPSESSAETIANAAAPVTGNPALAALLGAGMSIGFYGLLFAAIRWLPENAFVGQLNRYFLGHPVAIAATILFSFALAILIAKSLALMVQKGHLARIRDADLRPVSSAAAGPADQWLAENDAGHVARDWLSDLDRLPAVTRSSQLVTRLQEVLTRQSQRGSTKHLADDLRELSGRDADGAHDSLGLVRIIVWAIPMLGFLGTVIGITQTLGGLDFSSGTAAVDNLKSGLYVAFDTTAMGLVLSVFAIFLQFPVERSEQRLLAMIDARVGHLVSSTLPSDEASDNHTVLIAELCRGVQAAVAQSLADQATLWRDTIESAQSQWQEVHEKNNNTIADAFEVTLAPALLSHAQQISASSTSGGQRFEESCRQLQNTINGACQSIASQQQLLAAHYDAIDRAQVQISDIAKDQTMLQQGIADVHGDGMVDAMRTLARAVELLADRADLDSQSPKRHAA